VHCALKLVNTLFKQIFASSFGLLRTFLVISLALGCRREHYAPWSSQDMPSYREIAEEIERLIHQEKMVPGDALPPERKLAERFGVSYGMIRMANDFLSKKGVIVRRHGQGSFIAGRSDGADGLRHRIGLLMVDLEGRAGPGPYYQQLTHATQNAAHERGYEVSVGQLNTADLIAGKPPRMLQQRSVDAVILDGRIRQHHIKFIQDLGILHVCTGDNPVGWDVPQVKYNFEQLGKSVVTPLLEAGRSPIWLDGDPTDTEYYAGQELFRGVKAALQDSGEGLHICLIKQGLAKKVAKELMASDLKRGAIVVQDPAWQMVSEELAREHPDGDKIWFVPLPWPHLAFLSSRPNHAQWRTLINPEQTTGMAVNKLLDVLEKRSAAFESVSVEFDCRLVSSSPQVCFDLKMRNEDPAHAFTLDRYAGGASWKRVPNGSEPEEVPTAQTVGVH
jgi:hypothetical protein